MKLKAFRIRNFRSIVDTGWQSISPDNITCLIGQNESGKTSVLEALRVFYSGEISEDVLRSDLSFPEVNCRFTIPDGWLLSVTENPGTELKELLSGLNHLELTRTWIADLSSVLKVSGEISQYLDSLEDAWRLYLNDVKDKLVEEMVAIKELEASFAHLIDEENDIRQKLSPVENKTRGFGFFGRKQIEPEAQNIQYPGLKNRLNDIKKQKEEINDLLHRKQTIRKAGEKYKKLEERCLQSEGHLNELSVKLEERHQKMTLLMRPFDVEQDSEWKDVLFDFRKTRADKEQRNDDLEKQIALLGYILEGLSEADAEVKVNEIIQFYKSQYNSELLGKKYFEYCPVFELFEDFGSLLPNRIDMDDIVSGNENVEGYKAARNFLSLAQLDYSFFQQPSSRILKQKIENLNNSLTKNFHDFWQQSIGRNNKINIQFELDHYSTNYEGKAGKPYLEFWIKDEGERLYPKQRSRGVRWFLSFYMELKAAATMKDRQMVLLVDEPGVSLHARAQEDVLKVFEDIKDNIQVIYTTHSPHLVEINKLHRILAVQRDDMDNLRSTSRILDPLQLSMASPDTLTPLQSILGNPLGGTGFSSKQMNLIVNDTGSFYMLNAIMLLSGVKTKINVIPSTNVASIPLLCNIFLGWGMDFAVMLFENEEEIRMSDYLKGSVFKTDKDQKDILIRMPGAFLNAEDIISTLDFKSYLLESREGITVPNSVYIRENELPRNFLMSRFLAKVKDGKLKISDFDEESIENFNSIKEVLRSLK